VSETADKQLRTIGEADAALLHDRLSSKAAVRA